MEPLVLWQHKWSADLFVPGYLFFGGLSGGLVIIAALADLVGLWQPRLLPLARRAGLAALVCLGIAGLLLTTHLGKPERGLGFPLFFTNYESWMTRGGWVVGAAGPLVAAYAAFWWFGVLPRLRRVVGLVAIPLAGLLAMYTGFLLSGAGYVPLWSRAHLPLLFLSSALTTGTAAAGLLSVLALWVARPERRDPAFVRRVLGVALVVLIALELYELRQYVTYLAARAPDKALAQAEPTGDFVAPMGTRLAYVYLTGGPGYPWRLMDAGPGAVEVGTRTRPTLAPWFWVGVVGVGLVLPLVLTVLEFLAEAVSRALATGLALAKFTLVLVGGFLLRVVLVWGGDLKAPLPFPPQLWPLGGPGALPPIPGVGG